MKENQVFDHYSDILTLKYKDDTIQSGTPLQTCLYNRLAYVIRNEQRVMPRRLLILPYLHERKLYLNRRQHGNQFYTLIKHNDKNYILCFCLSDSKIYVYTETGILVERILYNDKAYQYGKPVVISENGQYFIFRKSDFDQQLTLMKVTIEGFEVIKIVKLKDIVEEYIGTI